jgi:glycosyltransferase involved in cell wall biosynthesis
MPILSAPPLVSVIIPAYNSAAFIERAIRSILTQNYHPLEIVVIDDGSTDNTGEVVAALEGPIRCERQPNAGAAAARNRGIQISQGAFIAFLDSDDEWLPGRLEKTAHPLMEDPELGMAYCRSWREAPDGKRTLEHAEQVRHRLPYGLYPPPYLQTSAALVRRACFDRCGLIDTTFPVNEDEDLFIRIAEEYPVLQIEEPLVLIHDRPGSLSRSQKVEIAASSILRLANKTLARGKTPLPHNGVLSVAHMGAGIQYFDAGKMSKARHYFLKGFWLRPSWRCFQFFLRTLVPRYFYQAIRNTLKK